MLLFNKSVFVLLNSNIEGGDNVSFFSRLFSGTEDGSTVRVRQNNEDNAKIVGDKFEHCEDGGHTHRSYDLDTASGGYKEYSGGENSPDRSYNK